MNEAFIMTPATKGAHVLESGVWLGVLSLLDHYANARAGDIAVVAYTPDSREAAACVCVALEARNIDTRRVCMRPLSDEGFHARFVSALPAPAELAEPGHRLLVFSFERDTMSHDASFRRALSAYAREKCVVIRAISAGPELFMTAMNAIPSDLSARNAAILERCMSATHLQIKTRGGTDLRVSIDSERYRWISNRGVWRPGSIVILPAGEVATYPASIDGVLVADFAYNVNAIADRDCRLNSKPVKVWIQEGRVARYECDEPETTRFLDECFRERHADRVGELGFGTNPFVGEPLAANSHINERRCGVHVGFGLNNQGRGVVERACTTRIHLDLIARGGEIWIDGDPACLDLENIVPSSGAHPLSPRDEDVFSPELEVDDCCGVLTRDGLRPFPGQKA